MPTRSINLTDHYADFLTRAIETGRYKDPGQTSGMPGSVRPVRRGAGM